MDKKDNDEVQDLFEDDLLNDIIGEKDKKDDNKDGNNQIDEKKLVELNNKGDLEFIQVNNKRNYDDMIIEDINDGLRNKEDNNNEAKNDENKKLKKD